MRGLLLLHGVLALALVGSLVHHAVSCLPWLWGKKGAPRLTTLHASIGLVLFLAVFVIGLVLYPSYKVHVRVEAFDVPRAAGGLGLAWLSRLFDVKEHLVALALPAVVGLYALTRELDLAALRERRLLYVGISLFAALAVVTSALIGLYVVMFKAVS